MARQKWEYTHETIVTKARGREDRIDEARLNELGEDGWEMVVVNDGGTEAIFKRPKEEAKETDGQSPEV